MHQISLVLVLVMRQQANLIQISSCTQMQQRQGTQILRSRVLVMVQQRQGTQILWSGNGAKNANNSTFIGLSAGQGCSMHLIQISLVRMHDATSANQSNFFGRQLVKMQQMLLFKFYWCWY
jgi:hypothetical protein